MTRQEISRRRLLQLGAGVGAAVALGPELAAKAAAVEPAGSGGTEAIEHVIFLIQENRSFDHYYGTMSGVRGFDDRSFGDQVFKQAWPGGATPKLLPFHFDVNEVGGAWVNDIDHSWGGQHTFWNNGEMNQFVSGHIASDGPTVGTACMGYYTQSDLPFYYALADNFTICDNYHCSVMACTYPNRLYSLTAMIDPAGIGGGPVTSNPSIELTGTGGILNWTTMPEQLQAAGISWKVYEAPVAGEYMQDGNNILPLFTQYQDPTSPLYQNAFLPTFPGTFEADCVAGTLPQVSWVLTQSPGFDEHPPCPSSYGESMVSLVMQALLANTDTWSKTVLFITYDEQGGFFDHVTPPTPEPGTPGEFLTASGGVAQPGDTDLYPIGLGFRVPMLVVSPFSRGGYVCSDVFDHTSMLQFLETRFGAEVPNITDWRRETCGDLTTAFAKKGNDTPPDLPQPYVPPVPQVIDAAGVIPPEIEDMPTPPYPPPTVQKMPRQDPGTRKRRPS
ncbi:MAG: alkaline phosphatase family protein [Acidimicrobiales bacterium]